MPEENAVVEIRRISMRGGDNKIEIVLGNQIITIQPTKLERYDLVSLISGGAGEKVRLAAKVK